MQTTRSLTPAQLRDLEAELHAERARLERSMAVTAEATGGTTLVSEGDGAPDGGDSAGDVDVAVRSSVQARHEAIRAALRRLDEGSYGTCTECQEPIPFGRLLVMPESERCVACGPLA